MSSELSWLPPPLTPNEERLVNIYLQTNTPLDALPYTEKFEELVKSYCGEETRDARHDVLMELLRLRKQGRLPRISWR